MTKTRVVHCKKEPYDVLIDRTTKWGNPFRIGKDGNRKEVLKKYRTWLFLWQSNLIQDARRELKGKVLGCWCKPNACHGDILVEICDRDVK
jgi:hypothetical protein